MPPDRLPDRPGIPVEPTNLHRSSHPLVRHKLTLLRSRSTEPKKFREVVRELASLRVETPLTDTMGAAMAEKVGLVPILRAGLGMVEGAWELLPQAEVWHLGLYRDERTLRPVEYYNKLPIAPRVDLVLLLDPMLATGGSAIAACDVLKRWGVKRIKFVGLVAAPEGIAALHEAHPDVAIHVAEVDERLTVEGDAFPAGFIWPGLGDAGDRQFGTG
jgi:uracil phosphoribosyltransferase